MLFYNEVTINSKNVLHIFKRQKRGISKFYYKEMFLQTGSFSPDLKIMVCIW